MVADSEKAVKEFTALAFAIKDDTMKVHMLTALTSVSLPAGFAILIFYNPEKFPVLDIRVWQQLYKAKLLAQIQRDKVSISNNGKHI